MWESGLMISDEFGSGGQEPEGRAEGEEQRMNERWTQLGG